LRAVDKQRILSYYGRVSDETMQRVEEALEIATGLKKF
jgi:mRNA-degrading endonuclease toxin of MazEF toxin-antitoxin module